MSGTYTNLKKIIQMNINIYARFPYKNNTTTFTIFFLYHYLCLSLHSCKKNSKINNGIQNENDKSTQQKPYSQLNILFLFISIPLKNMYLRLNNQTPNQKE